MGRRPGSMTFWYFAIGLFSATSVRIIGSIAIAEAVVCVVAPFMFLMDANQMRRNGFMTPALLCLLACLGCCLSSWYNQTDFVRFIKGAVTTYSMFAALVVAHHLFSRDIEGVKWFFVGGAISSLITIFAFRAGAEEWGVMMHGVENVRQSGLFIMAHFGPLVTLPLFGWYLSTPLWLSVPLFVFPSIHSMATSATGRSAVLMTLMSVGLLLFAGKSLNRMRTLKRQFYAVMMVGFVIALGFASFYKYAAKAGYLNQAAAEKYRNQVARNDSHGLLGMIMSGRAEFFVSLFAVKDHPFVGFGPWAVDTENYWARFLEKWGSAEDLRAAKDYELWRFKNGIHDPWLPCHSQLLQFWVWYGILGVPIMLWQLWKMFVLMRRHLDAVPQWFGYFAMTIPSALWGIFFSPFGSRLTFGFSVAMLIVAIRVGEGKMRLPPQMIGEIMKYGR